MQNVDYSQSVGNTSTLLLPKNSHRVHATIVNDSDETIYIALGHPAVSSKGKRLNSGGGSFEITTTNPWYGEVNGICASGGKNACIEDTSYES